MKKMVILLFVVLILAGLVYLYYPRTPGTGPSPVGNETEATLANLGQFKSISSFLVFQEPSITARASHYELPVNLKDVEYADKLTLTNEEKDLLAKNGFVITKGHWHEFPDAYGDIHLKFPIFVTADSILHTYHVLFDDTLKSMEEEIFYDELVNLTSYMLEKSKEDYEKSSGDLKEAAKRNVAYFSVAMKLLNPDFKPPSYVQETVSKELARIEKHEGFEPSLIFNSNCNPLGKCYAEDYSQYVPRGHYTQSEKLKRYFKAMMWYGRMAFFAFPKMLTEKDADLATIQAQLIALHLGESQEAMRIWDEIYGITSFFVGKADDLTPRDYLEVMREVYGDKVSVEEMAKKENLEKIRERLKERTGPRIYSGSGVCSSTKFGEKVLEDCLEKTIGMRFMGQRFILDSYVMGRLVYPTVGGYLGKDKPFTLVMSIGGPIRGFPRGLDVMATLGSEKAREILNKTGDAEYKDYWKALDNATREVEEFDGWRDTLYNAWLYSLKGLLEKKGEGYPTFMQTNAWELKDLKTALGSWTELRHDTILYAKQSYTPQALIAPSPNFPEPVEDGYVEPSLVLYYRLKALNNATLTGLEQLGIFERLGNGTLARERFQRFGKLLDRLIEISEKELRGERLSDEDKEYISGISGTLGSCTEGISGKTLDTRLVADVHTDINSGEVLEEGTGNLDLIFVIYKDGDKLKVGAGPVFSYYEFKHPMNDRLTDEKWREEVLANMTEVEFLGEIQPRL